MCVKIRAWDSFLGSHRRNYATKQLVRKCVLEGLTPAVFKFSFHIHSRNTWNSVTQRWVVFLHLPAELLSLWENMPNLGCSHAWPPWAIAIHHTSKDQSSGSGQGPWGVGWLTCPCWFHMLVCSFVLEPEESSQKPGLALSLAFPSALASGGAFTKACGLYK